MYALESNGASFLVDGTFTRYSPDYSDNVDGMDARKMSNPGENIGMLRNNITLVIESRQIITLADTIFFKMWGMQKKSYQMQFVPSNLNNPGLQAFLEDSYLHSSTPISLTDTTKISFAISSDAASSAMYRFRVVFKTVLIAIPNVFTNVNAYPQNNNVIVEWQILHKPQLKSFTVQKSVEGNVFIDEAPVNPQNILRDSYRWVDNDPAQGDNYYRIRSLDADGKIEYSNVMKVYVSRANQGIMVYPNPATINNLNLQLNNQQAGIYEIHLINSYGERLALQTFNHPGGSGNEKLNLGRSVPKGVYQLEIITPVGEKKVVRVIF